MRGNIQTPEQEFEKNACQLVEERGFPQPNVGEFANNACQSVEDEGFLQPNITELANNACQHFEESGAPGFAPCSRRGTGDTLFRAQSRETLGVQRRSNQALPRSPAPDLTLHLDRRHNS